MLEMQVSCKRWWCLQMTDYCFVSCITSEECHSQWQGNTISKNETLQILEEFATTNCMKFTWIAAEKHYDY